MIKKLLQNHFFTILLLFAAFMSCLYIQPGHDWGGDFSCYIAQANSIISCAMEDQVSTNTYIVTNSHYMHGPGSYPWGFPLLLVPIIKVFGINYIALKSLNVLFFVGSIIIVYRLFSSHLDPLFARVGSIFIAVSPAFLSATDFVLSDIPFFFFSCLSLYFIDRLYRSPSPFSTLLTGLSCSLAYFIRTNGIVSILTLLFVDLFLIIVSRITMLSRIKSLTIFHSQNWSHHLLVYCFFIVTALLGKFSFPSSDISYGHYFESFSLSSIFFNLKHYLLDLRCFFGTSFITLSSIFTICWLLALFGGCISLFFSELPVLVYFAGTSALVILFPAYQGIRYLFPAIPCAILIALKFIQHSIYSLQHQSFKRLGKALLVLVILCMLVDTGKFGVKRFFFYDRVNSNESYSIEAQQVYSYLSKNTSPNDIVAFFKPRVLWLNTHRKGFSIGENNIERLSDVDYALFLQSQLNSSAAIAVQSNDGNIRVFENDKFVLYRIKS